MPTSRSFNWATGLTKKEPAFGTAMDDSVLLDWLEVEEVDQAETNKEYRTNEKSINGRLGATEYELESATGQMTRKMQASVEAFAAFIIWITGRTTQTGSADPWTQTIKLPTVCTLTPPSFSLIEGLNCAGASATYTLFKGCSVESLTLEATGKSFATLTVNIKTDGSETAKAAFSFPASVKTVKKLLGRYMTLALGPLGTEDISADIRSFKLTVSTGLVIPPSVTGGIFVPKYQYQEGHPMVDFEFTMAGDRSSAIYGYYKNDTQLINDFFMNSGVTPLRSIRMTNAACYLESLKPTREGSEPRLAAKLKFLHNATDDGSATFITKSGASGYLTNG